MNEEKLDKLIGLLLTGEQRREDNKQKSKEIQAQTKKVHETEAKKKSELAEVEAKRVKELEEAREEFFKVITKYNLDANSLKNIIESIIAMNNSRVVGK